MDAADLLDLLGNENRRRILAVLARKPRYVTEIGDLLGLSPKAVIGHLRKLEAAGLIESTEGRARRKYFSIVDPLRLEVTLSPYEFTVKRSYPQSSGPSPGEGDHVDVDLDTDDLATELDQLLALRQDLSLAQRRLEGRVAGTLDRLAEESEADRLGAAVALAIANGARSRAEIAARVGIPPEDVAHVLAVLAREDVINHRSDGIILSK
ncbi:helix-turn-helix domain-containing protein [Halococcoides cellulosivorans]|uniref:MarR family transcriptional regulator n=1 Tax=Halococcoides cellulosivorans TaxID=1679096 RepID=A0A2R4WYZ0_9EURY|nr:helix-turn-helix domain-containing protein [Halococcoides cellulosivorans]AWB26735.1 MarR family transcriptional regulator [Halococcoides cellulosivorans]